MLLLCILVASFWGVFSAITKISTSDATNEPEHVFYTKYGALLCGTWSMGECGIHLKDCMDEREYFCLHDVAIK